MELKNRAGNRNKTTTTGKKSVKLLYVDSMTESSKEKTLKRLILIREFNKVA